MSVAPLLLPDHIIADLEREAEADAHIGRAREVDAELKALNHRLELVWVGERATSPGLVRCRWHVRRRDRDAGVMDAYFPIVGPDGEYVEPTSQVVEMMRRNDLWKTDVRREVREHREARQREIEAQRKAASEENIENFALRAKAKINPGVSFNTARPWTNRVERLPGA